MTTTILVLQITLVQKAGSCFLNIFLTAPAYICETRETEKKLKRHTIHDID